MVTTGYIMLTSPIIFLISSVITGITANSYCDQQLKQLRTTTRNIKKKCSAKNIVIKTCCDANALNIFTAPPAVYQMQEECGVPLVFSVILKQQMEDGQ